MTSSRFLVVFAATVLSVQPQAPSTPKVAESPKPSSAERELAAKLDRYLVDSGFAGCALVAKDGRVLLEKGYGEADHERHVPFKKDTLVSIGSITKQFTAAAIVKLEMEKKLTVEDSITRFFPDAPEDKRSITIHQLLTHTAGLESDFAGDYDAVGRDDYVKRILASKLRSAPGKEHFYANAGYSLLGAIVEIASKEPYETYLAKHLFEPAGMRETGYRLPKWDKSRAPVGYRDGQRWGTMFDKPWADDGPYWALRANGGIESTLEDLWKWSRVLDDNGGENVLCAAAKKKMFTPHVAEGPGAESFYGYGWSISTAPWGKKVVEHNGGNGVFSADFRRYVDDGIVVITFSNDSRVKAWKFSGPLARIARGEDVAAGVPESSALTPLGDSAHHAVVRKFVEAFNTGEIAKIRSFRNEYIAPRPGVSDDERDRMAQRMFDEMKTLTVEGVIADSADAVNVRMKTGRGESVRFRFVFNAEDKISAIAVEAED
jgi:CubicO group peptidase (beta-lactamase class C family)